MLILCGEKRWKMSHVVCAMSIFHLSNLDCYLRGHLTVVTSIWQSLPLSQKLTVIGSFLLYINNIYLLRYSPLWLGHSWRYLSSAWGAINVWHLISCLSHIKPWLDFDLLVLQILNYSHFNLWTQHKNMIYPTKILFLPKTHIFGHGIML